MVNKKKGIDKYHLTAKMNLATNAEWRMGPLATDSGSQNSNSTRFVCNEPEGDSMSDTHQGNPAGTETAKLLLKTGVRIDDAERAVSCATGLAGLARYVPKQFRTLTTLAQGLEVAPEAVEVPPGQVFPYINEGKIDPLARVILLAGLNTAHPDRFEIEDPFEMRDEMTSKLVNEMRANFHQQAIRLLSTLSDEGLSKSGRRGRR